MPTWMRAVLLVLLLTPNPGLSPQFPSCRVKDGTRGSRGLKALRVEFLEAVNDLEITGDSCEVCIPINGDPKDTPPLCPPLPVSSLPLWPQDTAARSKLKQDPARDWGLFLVQPLSLSLIQENQIEI